MRILYVVHQFLPEFSAGTERVALNLAHAAQRAGHRADVLTWSGDADAGWHGTTREGFRAAAVEGLSVTGIPAAMVPDPYGFEAVGSAATRQAIDGFLATGQYDLVHVLHGLRMADVLARVRALRIPYLVTLTDFFLLCHRINLTRAEGAGCAGPEGGAACVRHCAPDDPAGVGRRRTAARALLEGARVRVACSPFVAETFAAEHPDLDWRVVPHGIDWRPAPPRRAAREAPGVFGYVGTMSEAKGVGTLARAFAATDLDARLELVGPAGDGDCLAGLEDPRIVRRGPVPAQRVPEVLAGFDVLCLPTRLPETFSLALHEGFAAGLPCLVSDLGHPAAVVREAGCGRVLPPGDVPAWSAAITEAASPQRRDAWRARVPLPWRTEEEAFLYSQLYRACIAS